MVNDKERMMADDSLKGRLVMVVGGSSGIGLAVAEAAARQGAGLILAGRDPAKLEAAAARAGGAKTVSIDLRRLDSVLAAAEGIERVDHLVITAGGFAPAALEASTPDDWRGVLEERLIGPLALVKALGPRIAGSITLFSGTIAQRPFPGSAILAAAASGVESAVRALALELAPVRVNAVAPGMVDTPMLDGVLGAGKADAIAATAARLPARHVGTADDIAQAVLFLMANRYMTGKTIEIDGGAPLI